jgi:hypothetical protein
MSHNRRRSSGRRLALGAEMLEHRTLLSASAPGHQDVVIQVPSAYISQQSSQLDVTLMRTYPSGKSDPKGSITVDFSATYAPGSSGQQFTPVNTAVTFPAGQATETVAIPINSSAANPGLVPVDLAVTSSTRQVKGSSTTVYLASSADAVPPSIVDVERVAGGIAITFSKPMDPATVQNIHNYVVKFRPSQSFNLQDLYGVGLVETPNNTPDDVPLRRATYDPATDTVLLVATEQLGSKGSYQIKSPASLTAKKGGPNKAHPLTDPEGNVLDQGGSGGTFKVSISEGKPYAAAVPTLALGN